MVIYLNANSTHLYANVKQNSSGDTVNLLKYGVKYNDNQDASVCLQKAIDDQKVIIISGNIIIRKNIYLWGKASLIAKNRAHVTIDGDFANADGRKYVINCGIKAKNGDVSAWTGQIKNIKFVGSSSAAFAFFIQLHTVKGVLIDNNEFDFTQIPQTDVRGDLRGCAIEGLNDRQWNKGSVSRKDIIISNNRVINKQDYPGQEGIGITNAQNVVFSSNYLYGMADDGIALHKVDGFKILNNKLYLVAGRLYVADSKNGVINGNYIERIPMQSSRKWMNAESFIKVEPERGRNADQDADIENIDIVNNTILLPDSYSPAKRSKTYIIRLIGVKNCNVNNNILHVNCSKDFVTSPIVVENPLAQTSRVSNLSLSVKQLHLKSGNVMINDNKISGVGASEPKALGMSDTRGIVFHNNTVGN